MSSKKGRESKKFKNPVNGMRGTALFWATYLDITPNAFRWRVKRYGADNPHTYREERYMNIPIAEPGDCGRISGHEFLSPCRLYHGTLCDIAKLLDITTKGMYNRIQKYGEKDVRTYLRKPHIYALRNYNVSKIAGSEKGMRKWYDKMRKEIPAAQWRLLRANGEIWQK